MNKQLALLELNESQEKPSWKLSAADRQAGLAGVAFIRQILEKTDNSQDTQWRKAS